MAVQTVFKRYELKYLLSEEQKGRILAAMAPYMEPDAYGRSAVRSLYFDTDNYRLARRSIEKPAYKEKLRIRSHGTGGEVRIALKKEKGHAVLSVANDGAPIPPEQQAHLFEHFWRGDAARSGEGGHYGLGLAIAHAIAASHKGSLGVRCRGGKVIFTAKLPLKK